MAASTSAAVASITISSVQGLRDESDTDPVGLLAEHLRERRLLPILDNCEHLTKAGVPGANDI
ncbi:hypothetical protein [Rhodococcus opacus]|uniref:Uncharacterized protein n=1 Tax=Rhodococcus opacus TaxID=37919 RepID=A0A076EZP5_RHOOP|nr:hypothetical protein [Rhodococcus opacus]AII10898.1 hypothetical protein EP51_42920 [Rhodococcus opacus]